MKSLRVLSLAATFILAASFGYSDDLLGKKPKGDGNGSSSQGDRRPDRKPDNGQRPRDEGQKPRNDDSRPRPRDESPRPRGNDDNLKPRPSQGPPPPPREERPQPRPRNDEPRPRGNDDNLKPRPSQGPPPPREERPQPRPRNDEPRPRINDDNLKPRPGNGPPQDQGKPRDDGSRPRGGDDLLRPRPGNGNNGGSNQGGDRPDRNPFPRDRNPQINNPPANQNGQLGRIDNGSRPRQGDNMLGRRGGNAYGGTVSNSNRGEGQRGQPFRIDRAPVDIFRGGLAGQVLREDRFRVNRSSWRSGYYHYNNNWCDDNFFFNWYVFDPFRSSNCFISPWYYYPHLPGYVNRRCGTIISINLSPWYGSYYNYRRPANYDGYYDNNSYNDYSGLDYAIEDIRRAFQDNDRRSLERLMPTRDRVAIFVDGEYTYSMEPRDFEDFLIDAVEGTRTTQYQITRVERRGREAEVQARHEYEDPWGRRAVVYHTFRLEDVRGYYVITRFGTSYYR